MYIHACVYNDGLEVIVQDYEDIEAITPVLTKLITDRSLTVKKTWFERSPYHDTYTIWIHIQEFPDMDEPEWSVYEGDFFDDLEKLRK